MRHGLMFLPLLAVSSAYSQSFEACFGVPIVEPCGVFDLDSDGDVDETDFILIATSPFAIDPGRGCEPTGVAFRFYNLVYSPNVLAGVDLPGISGMLRGVEANFNIAPITLCGEFNIPAPFDPSFSIANITLQRVVDDNGQPTTQYQVQAGYGYWRNVEDRPPMFGESEIFVAQYYESLQIDLQTGNEVFRDRHFFPLNTGNVSICSDSNRFFIIDESVFGVPNQFLCGVNNAAVVQLDLPMPSQGRGVQFGSEHVNPLDFAPGSNIDRLRIADPILIGNGFSTSEFDFSSSVRTSAVRGPATPDSDGYLSLWRAAARQDVKFGNSLELFDLRNPFSVDVSGCP